VTLNTLPEPRKLFAELVAQPDEKLDLAEAALLVACEEYPGLDVSGYLARLSRWAGALRERIQGDTPEAIVAGLNRLLFEEEGFRGNTKDYYDPRNSFLNDVLDRRIGIPITLSAVYMEVARRAGFAASGVGLPGHFLVRLRARGGERLIDPFHEGVMLSRAECQERLDLIYDGKLKLEAEMLAACGRKAMLGRMLRNLKAIYVRSGDQARALGIVELLLILNPESAEDLRDRGLIHAALDCYAYAARDLGAYLERAPKTHEAATLRRKLEEMHQKAQRLN
jgi:regulator of sirC expression with transglutaminase-like and TPR domain